MSFAGCNRKLQLANVNLYAEKNDSLLIANEACDSMSSGIYIPDAAISRLLDLDSANIDTSYHYPISMDTSILGVDSLISDSLFGDTSLWGIMPFDVNPYYKVGLNDTLKTEQDSTLSEAAFGISEQKLQAVQDSMHLMFMELKEIRAILNDLKVRDSISYQRMPQTKHEYESYALAQTSALSKKKIKSNDASSSNKNTIIPIVVPVGRKAKKDSANKSPANTSVLQDSVRYLQDSIAKLQRLLEAGNKANHDSIIYISDKAEVSEKKANKNTIIPIVVSVGRKAKKDSASKAPGNTSVLQDSVLYLQDSIAKLQRLVEAGNKANYDSIVYISDKAEVSEKNTIIPIVVPVGRKAKKDSANKASGNTSVLQDSVLYLQDSIAKLQRLVESGNKGNHDSIIYISDKAEVSDTSVYIAFYRINKIIADNHNAILQAIEKLDIAKIEFIRISGFSDISGGYAINKRITDKRITQFIKALERIGVNEQIIFLQNFAQKYASKTVRDSDRKLVIKVISRP